jgi:amino-acid N-acetyltransferase
MMANENYVPTAAEKVTELFEGPSNLARAVGVSRSTVTRWTYPPSRKGTDGHIPGKYHQAIWDAARKQKIKIKPADLLSLDV